MFYSFQCTGLAHPLLSLSLSILCVFKTILNDILKFSFHHWLLPVYKNLIKCYILTLYPTTLLFGNFIYYFTSFFVASVEYSIFTNLSSIVKTVLLLSF